MAREHEVELDAMAQAARDWAGDGFFLSPAQHKAANDALASSIEAYLELAPAPLDDENGREFVHACRQWLLPSLYDDTLSTSEACNRLVAATFRYWNP